MKRATTAVSLAAAALIVSSGAVFAQPAQDYPNRAIRMLVPYAPGGATDIIARLVAAKLNEAWGQAVVVDNRPGASGNIALEAAARATPDGYTLQVGNVSTNAINETTFASTLRITPSKDLMGITNLIEIPHIFAVPGNFAAANIKQFIEMAKKAGTKYNYGSAGIGSYPHLDGVVFMRAAGIQMTHVPYKGGAGQMIPAIIGGEVQCMFINLASSLQNVKAGRIKPLATTWPTRVPDLPNVPTMTEEGFPGIGTNAWNGLFAPAGVPRPILDRIFAKVTEVANMPEVKDQLGKQLMTIVLSKSPQDYQKFVRSETEKWAKVVKENNIRIE
jgi:tripartite-type tricarboxylate transporter receptor subunit TctC